MTNAFQRIRHLFHGPSDLLDYAASTAPVGVHGRLDAAITAATNGGVSWATILAAIESFLGSLNWEAIISAIIALIPLLKPKAV